MRKYRGECLCGAIRYVIEGSEPRAMFLCHCSRCRKLSGTAHAANVFFEGAELRFEHGEAGLTHFRLEGTRKAQTFCSTCGSAMPRRSPRGHIVLPAGSLDAECSVTPTAHIYCDSAASWEAGVASAPRFAELPEKA